jgi:hypothetical protein
VKRNINWILECAVVIAAGLMAAGCATKRVHYGHTEEEWTAMTEQQQAKAKAEFEQLVKTREEDQRREQMDNDLQKIIDRGGRARTP